MMKIDHLLMLSISKAGRGGQCVQGCLDRHPAPRVPSTSRYAVAGAFMPAFLAAQVQVYFLSYRGAVQILGSSLAFCVCNLGVE